VEPEGSGLCDAQGPEVNKTQRRGGSELLDGSVALPALSARSGPLNYCLIFILWVLFIMEGPLPL